MEKNIEGLKTLFEEVLKEDKKEFYRLVDEMPPDKLDCLALKGLKEWFEEILKEDRERFYKLVDRMPFTKLDIRYLAQRFMKTSNPVVLNDAQELLDKMSSIRRQTIY